MLEQPTATRTIVSFLLDRTGSMAAIKDETIGGFNAYLDTLESQVGDLIEFTLLQFDSQSIDTLCVGAELSDVKRLTPETYQPRAYTPLIDACINHFVGHGLLGAGAGWPSDIMKPIGATDIPIGTIMPSRAAVAETVVLECEAL